MEWVIVECMFSASMEMNPPHPSGGNALSKANISRRGFYFEVGEEAHASPHHPLRHLPRESEWYLRDGHPPGGLLGLCYY